MTLTIKEKGYYAEELAISYLKKQGMSLVEQNFVIRGGEIDVIMQDNDTLVFVEVRARTKTDVMHPFESITPAKCKKIQLAAQIFIAKRHAYNFHLRFDVIGVNLLNDQIEWLKNAF